MAGGRGRGAQPFLGSFGTATGKVFYEPFSKTSLMSLFSKLLFCAAFTAAASVGGFKELALNDERLAPIVDFATSSIKSNAPEGVSLTLSKIRSAEYQVVAGLNYQIELEMSNNGACEVT